MTAKILVAELVSDGGSPASSQYELIGKDASNQFSAEWHSDSPIYAFQ